LVTKVDEVGTSSEAEGIVTRDELLVMGCLAIWNKQGRKGYVVGDRVVGAESRDVVIAVECAECGKVKRQEEFSKASTGFLGKRYNCKKCARKSALKKRVQVSEKWKRYREENREQETKRRRKYREENLERVASQHHRRRARLNKLPSILTAEDMTAVYATFNNACALTGEAERMHDDHVVPISVGHGGSVKSNMIPLSAELNTSKHNAHIFEWFSANRERFNLEQSRFDDLIEYLASANEMTPTEYRKYVDWCFDNPMVICEETGELVFKDGAINARVNERKAIS